MPAYINMCIETWRFPFTLLNYNNLSHYTDLPIDRLKRFSMMQIADVVRVHVLRDHGGYWLDADTIMLSSWLPCETVTGDPVLRTNTIGFLRTEPHSDMFERWAEFQDDIINDDNRNTKSWSLMGNDFTDEYIKTHRDISIHPTDDCWPEVYMIDSDMPRMQKYRSFYFGKSYHLADIRHTDMIMLHNSWTHDWYKKLSAEELLSLDCTMSNFLRESMKK